MWFLYYNPNFNLFIKIIIEIQENQKVIEDFLKKNTNFDLT